MIIKNGATLFVSSPLRLKTLFTKPLKYIIQIFTGSGIEHAARYINGYVINMSGKGGELIKFDKWMKHFDVNGAKIHCIEPYIDFTDEQIKKLEDYDKSCIGKKYDALGAAVSALDEIKQVRDLDIKQNGVWCSQQCFDGYVELRLFPEQKDKLSPAELKKKLIKSVFFKDKWRRIN